MKKWGQHFLRSPEIAHLIVQTGLVNKNDVVIEIGPGKGILTGILSAQASKVKAIEIDSHLVAQLRNKYADVSNVEIVHEDILRFRLPDELKSSPFKVIANIPYNITSPIIFLLLDWHRLNAQFMQAILMVQHEVAQRLAASPGGKDYGVISVNLQMYAEVNIVREISADNFFPPPKVDSAIIQLSFLEEPRIALHDFKLFHTLVKVAFAQRRKTLWNNLYHSLKIPKTILEEMFHTSGIDPRRRAETLALEEFARLSELWYEYKNDIGR